jgi:CDP-diacylglycerol--serine O-phosphatidyltransferase
MNSDSRERNKLRPFRRHFQIRKSRRDRELFSTRGGRSTLNYIYPNLFTSASLYLALFSMVKSAEGDFVTACWLIFLSAVCDALDGPVARLTRSSSNFGLQYDSLADCVAFGVAPAFLMYSNLVRLDSTYLPTYASRLALGVSGLYAICAAIRLARFNVQADTAEKHHFIGLPTPGAAGTVVTAFLTVDWLSRYAPMHGIIDTREVTLFLHRTILLLMIALALLMVSEVRFSKLRHMLRFREKPFNVLVITIGIASALIVFSEFIQLLLFGAFIVYIVSMIVAHPRHRRSASPSPVEQPSGTGA